MIGDIMLKKITQLETLVLKLIHEKKEVSVSDIASAAKMSKSDEGDRKAIRRLLNRLVKEGLLITKGAARARTYVAITSNRIMDTNTLITSSDPFKDIQLSKKSLSLLKFISKPRPAKAPIEYNQDFLYSYQPNKDFYLSKEQRIELMKSGLVENKILPAGTYARHIMNRLLIDLSWNSSRLEGNTYSLLETKRLIELGESAIGKEASEAQMILNHKDAIEYIVESILEKKITSHQICSIHALLSENLLGDPSASGRIRQIAVGIKGTNYIPLDNPYTLKESFMIFIEKFNLIKDPFEQSFFALVHLSYIQAFEDVNKRTARLVANIPLIKKNLRPLSFTDVNNEAYVKSLICVYEKNDINLFRDLYLWAYLRSAQHYTATQQAMGEPNLLKLKYRAEIQEIIRTIILKKVTGAKIVPKIQNLLEIKKLSKPDTEELFKLIEIEILSLHNDNIARYKIRPSEFQQWKSLCK